MSAAPPGPRTQRPDGGGAIRTQFVAFFVIAAGGSIVLSQIGRTWSPVIWASAWMFVYLAVARWRSPDRFRTEDFADSFYYLGFLLTLVALVSVLVQLGGREEDLLGAVLSQFGLALVTTMIGLAGRVTLLMFQPDPEEVDQAARARVEDAYESLSQSLNRMAAEADAFTQSFGAKLRGTLEPIEASTHRFAETVDGATEGISNVGSRVDGLSAELERIARDLAESAGALAGGLDSARERIDASGEAIDRRLSEAFDAIRSGAASMREVSATVAQQARESLTDLERAAATIRRDLESVSRSLAELPKNVEATASISGMTVRGLAKDLDALKQSLTGLRGDVDAIGGILRAGGTEMEDAIGAWKRSADDLERVHARLVQGSEGTSEAIVQVRRELAEGVRFLIDVLRREDDREPAEL